MGVVLGEHQLQAIDRLSNGKILCGGVGSGKSRTALAYYYICECQGSLRINGHGTMEPMKNPKDLYIITTAKKRDTLEWEDECVPFLLSKNADCRLNDTNVVVDSWNNIKKYLNVMNAFFIFDEQKVIGKGAWVKAFLRITKINHWILLSATPGDTWMDYVPVFIANGYFKNRTQFSREHVIYNRFSRYPKVERYVGEDKLNRIKNELLVTMPVKRKTERYYINVKCEWDNEKFKRIHNDRWNIYEDEPIQQISEVCYLERKVVNSDASRIEALANIMQSRDKAIIFYSYDYELDILREFGKKLKVKVAELNGHKHEPVPKGSRWLYLVNYSSGAEGWNCTVTDTVIFFSQTYSYKTYEQACGRIDRINTNFEDLYYYNLISDAPIDRAINRALRNKRLFNERDYIL